MEFNWVTFNGKAAPATTPMLVKLGERVRLRIVNIGMDQPPDPLHGMQFAVTGSEGGRIPEALWYPQNTVLVGVAQARVVEFDAEYPGDWMLHCHLPHHMMNQMVSMVGLIAPAGHGMRTGSVMEEGNVLESALQRGEVHVVWRTDEFNWSRWIPRPRSIFATPAKGSVPIFFRTSWRDSGKLTPAQGTYTSAAPRLLYLSGYSSITTRRV